MSPASAEAVRLALSQCEAIVAHLAQRPDGDVSLNGVLQLRARLRALCPGGERT
jgi:hypothetical protein